MPHTSRQRKGNSINPNREPAARATSGSPPWMMTSIPPNTSPPCSLHSYLLLYPKLKRGPGGAPGVVWIGSLGAPWHAAWTPPSSLAHRRPDGAGAVNLRVGHQRWPSKPTQVLATDAMSLVPRAPTQSAAPAWPALAGRARFAGVAGVAAQGCRPRPIGLSWAGSTHPPGGNVGKSHETHQSDDENADAFGYRGEDGADEAAGRRCLRGAGLGAPCPTTTGSISGVRSTRHSRFDLCEPPLPPWPDRTTGE